MIVVRPAVPVALTRAAELTPEPMVFDLGVRRSERAAPVHHGPWGTLVAGWRRPSGIPRPSSAAECCVAAAMLGRALQESARWDPERLGVISASFSSPVSTALRFETRGLTEGWDLVDPLLLPSTLLSALSTQVAAATGARAMATSFVTGVAGVFHAFEAAVFGISRDDADAVLVVVADECTDVQLECLSAAALGSPDTELARAVVVERWSGRGARLHFVAYANYAGELPEGWADATVREGPSHDSPLQDLGLLATITEALDLAEGRAIVTARISSTCVASLGFSVGDV